MWVISKRFTLLLWVDNMSSCRWWWTDFGSKLGGWSEERMEVSQRWGKDDNEKENRERFHRDRRITRVLWLVWFKMSFIDSFNVSIINIIIGVPPNCFCLLKMCWWILTHSNSFWMPSNSLQNALQSFRGDFSASSIQCIPSVTPPLISTIWCFRPYKRYIFCEVMILATCQCHALLSSAQFTVV